MLIEVFLPVLGPILCCAGVGVLWRVLDWKFDTELVTRLVMVVGAPCLILSVLTQSSLSREAFTTMAWASLSLLVLLLMSAGLILRLCGLSLRSYLGSTVFSNTGNMGLPVCLFAFGEPGLALGLAVFLVLSFGQFTLGLALASNRSAWLELLTTPILYSILLAAGLLYTGYRPPLWLARSAELLGNMTIPLMLITLGVSLAQLEIRHLKLSLLLAVIKLGLGAGLGWWVATLFQLQGAAKGVLVVQGAMPVAVFNYLFAVRFQRAPEVVAGAVVISTLLSFFWLAWLLSYLQ